MNHDVKMWGSFLYFRKSSHSLISVSAAGVKANIYISDGVLVLHTCRCQQNFAALSHQNCFRGM